MIFFLLRYYAQPVTSRLITLYFYLLLILNKTTFPTSAEIIIMANFSMTPWTLKPPINSNYTLDIPGQLKLATYSNGANIVSEITVKNYDGEKYSQRLSTN